MTTARDEAAVFEPGDAVIVHRKIGRALTGKVVAHLPRTAMASGYYVAGSVRVRCEDGRLRTFDDWRVRPVSRPAVSPPPLTRKPDYSQPGGVVQVKPEKRWQSERYLRHIRAYPCCVCGAPPPSEAHHFGERGMGRKADDVDACPMCTVHHREWHDRGAFESHYMGRESSEAVQREAMRLCLRDWVAGRKRG